MQFDHQTAETFYPFRVLEDLFFSAFDVNLGQVDPGYLHRLHECSHGDGRNPAAGSLASDKGPVSACASCRIGLTDADLSIPVPKSRMHGDYRWIGPNVPRQHGEIRSLSLYRDNFRLRILVGEVNRCHTDV